MKTTFALLCLLGACASAQMTVVRQIGFSEQNSEVAQIADPSAIVTGLNGVLQKPPAAATPVSPGCANALILDFGHPVSFQGKHVQFVNICNGNKVVLEGATAAEDSVHMVDAPALKSALGSLNTATFAKMPAAKSTPDPSTIAPTTAPPTTTDSTHFTNTFAYGLGQAGSAANNKKVFVPGDSMPADCNARLPGLIKAKPDKATHFVILQTWAVDSKSVQDVLVVRKETVKGKTCFLSKKGDLRPTQDCASANINEAAKAIQDIHNVPNTATIKTPATITAQTICPMASEDAEEVSAPSSTVSTSTTTTLRRR